MVDSLPICVRGQERKDVGGDIYAEGEGEGRGRGEEREGSFVELFFSY